MKTAIRITVAFATLVLAAQQAGDRWWTRSFPPPAIRMAHELPVRFQRDQVIDIASGYLDTANAVPEGGVLLTGWAFDPRTETPVKNVVILDNDRPRPRTAHVYRDRPDIAMTRKNRALLHTGWVLWIPGDEIAPGRHVFTAYAALDDGKFGLVGTKMVELAPAK